jgi:GT2 family glycosyltransferase
MKKLLVIVVTYNGMRWLDRCLGSVAGDLYVLDNDSTDGSADYIQGHFPSAKLVRSADNLGFTGGNNLGFRYAMEKGYDYVYLMNQDAWLEEGALEKLVAAAEAHPDYAVLSPLQMTDGYKAFDAQFAKLFPSKGVSSPTCATLGTIRGRGPERREAPNTGRGREATVGEDTPFDDPIEVKRVMAAHWLMPVKALKEIGLFSELFPYYGQDDDWCHRAHYHGWKVGIVPSARAVHDRAQRQEPKERIIDRNYRVGSLIRLCDINRPLWERFLFVCLFTLVKAVKYRSSLPFKHFRSLIGQLPAIREHRRNSR